MWSVCTGECRPASRPNRVTPATILWCGAIFLSNISKSFNNILGNPVCHVFQQQIWTSYDFNSNLVIVSGVADDTVPCIIDRNPHEPVVWRVHALNGVPTDRENNTTKKFVTEPERTISPWRPVASWAMAVVQGNAEHVPPGPVIT
jgi:hypothetical protein